MKRLLIALAIFNAPMALGAAAPAAPAKAETKKAAEFPAPAAAAGYPAATSSLSELDRLRLEFGLTPGEVKDLLFRLSSAILKPEINIFNLDQWITHFSLFSIHFYHPQRQMKYAISIKEYV